MKTKYSLDELKNYHNEAIRFLGSELMLMKEAVQLIDEDRLSKASVILRSGGLNTGAAIIELSNQIEYFESVVLMLSRSFLEAITNFCYVVVCDEKDYRAFILHPVYKHFHKVRNPSMEDDFNLLFENIAKRQEKQNRLKEVPIVQEALSLFSEKNPNMNWSKKTLDQRISIIQDRAKIFGCFFAILKFQYYSDASELLHGSLYGYLNNYGTFDPNLDISKDEEYSKKSYKNNTVILLHLGFLLHDVMTLISHSTNIKQLWEHSNKNMGFASQLLTLVLEREPLTKEIREYFEKTMIK